ITRRVLVAFASIPIKAERRSKICCNTLAASGTAAGGGVGASTVATGASASFSAVGAGGVGASTVATGARASFSAVGAGPVALTTGAVGISVTGDATEGGRISHDTSAAHPTSTVANAPIASDLPLRGRDAEGPIGRALMKVASSSGRTGGGPGASACPIPNERRNSATDAGRSSGRGASARSMADRNPGEYIPSARDRNGRNSSRIIRPTDGSGDLLTTAKYITAATELMSVHGPWRMDGNSPYCSAGA